LQKLYWHTHSPRTSLPVVKSLVGRALIHSNLEAFSCPFLPHHKCFFLRQIHGLCQGNTPKAHLYPVRINPNFDPLGPVPYPLFAEKIQYSQGFAVIHPTNMHFYASIYNFGFPKGVPKISYDTFLYRFVSLFREIGELTNYPALLYPLCPITPWVNCGSKILRIY